MTFEMWIVASCSTMPPCDVVLRVGLHVLLDHLHAFDQHAALVGDDAQHAARLALALAGDHDDLVAFLILIFDFLLSEPA